jgi:MmyB-like transcription regulator ligand binding domain/Major intrinsic protein
VVAGGAAAGTISGGALNPAVTVAAAVMGMFAWSNLWVYTNRACAAETVGHLLTDFDEQQAGARPRRARRPKQPARAAWGDAADVGDHRCKGTQSRRRNSPTQARVRRDRRDARRSCRLVVAGGGPDDDVGELSIRSVEFRSWWSKHNVERRTTGIKADHHPLVGDLTVKYQALNPSGDPDQVLIVYTTEPGSADETSLRLLANWLEGERRNSAGRVN